MRKLVNLVRRAYGDPPLITDLETWARNAAKLTTPDDLIAASVIGSFAKDYDKWVLYGDWFARAPRYVKKLNLCRNREEYTAKLTNRSTKLAVCIYREKTSRDRDDIEPWIDLPDRCVVGGVVLNERASAHIVSAWKQISAKVKAAEEAAAKAKADMELNEAKWNLAEKLLGMKRNEYGALVPIQTAP